MNTTMNRHGPHRREAFTLIEAVVSVGAMALVAVGLAAIFQSVGKTIAGGKRLSALNQQAALIEQVMRRDFEQMTRDGVLVIRNQYTSNDGGTTKLDVLLWGEDNAPRPRRVDEIMFIAKGDFATAREPLSPSYVATSEFARIYYGHGVRARPGTNGYSFPDIDHAVDGVERFGLGVQNAFAGEWTLLRHQTLLAPPATSAPSLPSGLVFGYDPRSRGGSDVLSDKIGQIALQPAAGSLFRSLARYSPGSAVIPRRQYIRDEQHDAVNSAPDGRPNFASGLVDIASSDIAQLRALTTCGAIGNVLPMNITSQGVYQGPAASFTPSLAAIDVSRAWIEDLMPAPSDATAIYSTLEDNLAGTRIRYESAPPDYIGALTQFSDPDEETEAAYRRGDQLMLSASNFLNNCTEFVVEWSFGDVVQPADDVVWHGLLRRVDRNGDGALDTTATDVYPPRANGNPQFFKSRYMLPDGTSGEFDVPAQLVYGQNLPNPNEQNRVALTQSFGLTDPSSDSGRPWPWPSMIRVTLTLADPKEPANEQTFQFIFKVPENPS